MRLVRGVLAMIVLTAVVAGLPWALTHFIGWPLPNHLPSWAETQTVLLGPMAATFLLNVLACFTWLAWTMFALDVARCALAIVRDARMPDLAAAGPLRRIAAVLVGALLLSVPTTFAAADPPDGPRAVVTVPTAAPARPDPQAVSTTTRRPARVKSAAVLAYDPKTGVHDSLWRMAARTLGDGHRWPEIFQLNKGKQQLGGGTFTRPSLIFPGDEMTLPNDAAMPAAAATPSPPPPPPQSSSAPVVPPPMTSTPPSSPAKPMPSAPSPPSRTKARTTAQAAPPAQAPPGENARPSPGFSWGEELFVGLGLASAISAALVVVRHRNRRHYRPGSGDRTDLHVAPVVYQLRLAHRQADRNRLDDGEPDRESARERAPALSIGVRDGREIALDLATAHGLGLLGPGAPAAIRALLLTVLTTRPANPGTPRGPATAGGSATIMVPSEDLAALLGRHALRTPHPSSLHVVADLEAALNMLESKILVRAGRSIPAGRAWSPVVLAARTPGRHARRLQAVLDNGPTVGITGLLLGQWPAGVTAYVRDDGTICATSSGLGEPLCGARVFRLGDDYTADLLALLHSADHDTEPGRTTTRPRPSVAFPPRKVRAEEAAYSTVADSAHHRAGDAVAGQVTAGSAVTRNDRDLEIVGPTATPAATSAVSPGARPRSDRPAPARSESNETSGFTDSTASQSMASAPERPTYRRPAAGSQPADDGPRGHRSSDRGTPLAPLRISVLGPPRVWWRSPEATQDGTATNVVENEITSAFQPRLREMLVFLAVHPAGISREALMTALWATNLPARTTNAMNTSLSRIRRALTAATDSAVSDVVLAGEGRYRLDPNLVEVDYWSFAAAVATRRAAADDQQRIEAYRCIVDSYRGPLADGLSTDWIETAREAIRRDAIDAAAALARALVTHDPQQTLDLLEITRAFDPHNELVYRDIMRLQERLGQLDAIPRTLTLLTTRLAEIDEQPTHHTIHLAERLRSRHDLPADPSQADLRHGRAG